METYLRPTGTVTLQALSILKWGSEPTRSGKVHLLSDLDRRLPYPRGPSLKLELSCPL